LVWLGEGSIGVSINSAVCLAHLVAGAREELNARTNTQRVGNQREPDPLQLPPLQLGHCHVGPTRAGPTRSDSTARRPTAAEPRPFFGASIRRFQRLRKAALQKNQMGVRAEAESRKVPSRISRCPAH